MSSSSPPAASWTPRTPSETPAATPTWIPEASASCSPASFRMWSSVKDYQLEGLQWMSVRSPSLPFPPFLWMPYRAPESWSRPTDYTPYSPRTRRPTLFRVHSAHVSRKPIHLASQVPAAGSHTARASSRAPCRPLHERLIAQACSAVVPVRGRRFGYQTNAPRPRAHALNDAAAVGGASASASARPPRCAVCAQPSGVPVRGGARRGRCGERARGGTESAYSRGLTERGARMGCKYEK
ncbi:hypothetical protein DFH09DRAFT_1364154 [Mycena vulgaris]|nr:hypothetical protein DFH09DRAFT_1364154 [Mycena vulgaris]